MGLYDLPFLLKSMFASLIYMHDIILRHTPYLTVVAWSLEIEIQFYILAPLLFKVLKLQPVLRRIILLAAIIGIISLQSVYKLPVSSLYSYAQYFFSGILLADLYVSGVGNTSLNKSYISIAGVLLLAAILLMPHITGYFGMLLFPPVIIAFYMIVLKNDIFKKVFSYKFIPVIGGMCYSIYLLHYPIISMFGRVTMKLKITNYYLPNLFLQIALLMVPVLLLSGVYYYYIERPFMSSKWMDKLIKKNKKQETINPVIVESVEQ
jgi:peptidoglycan/LPS O-acetylase OafA/YrhL